MEFASRPAGARARVLRPTPRPALAGLVVLAGSALLTADGCRCERGGGGGSARDAGRPATAFALAGRVTDEIDRPLPEARVLALGPVGDGAPMARREARTDLGGRFAFEGLPRGRYTLLVEAVGLASIEPPAFEVPGPAPLVRLSGQGRSLSGSVVSADAPVAGARVRLAGAGGSLGRATLTDEAGRFVFHGLGAGAYALRATKGLLASPIATDVPTDAVPGAADVVPNGPPGAADAGARAPLRLVLGAGQGVEGVVVDESGRGLAGAEVRAETAPDDPLADGAASKPDGRFVLGPLPPGRFRLVARAPGHLLRAAVGVTITAGTGVPPQRLELVRAASAEGRVADARGAPVAGAQIRCGGGGADLADLAVIFEPLPLAAEAAATGGLPGSSRGGTKVARTDASGAFRLDDLVPGPVRLAVTRAPFAPLETETASLAPGEHRDLGVLTLRDAAAPDAGAPAPASAAGPADATLEGVARDSGNRPLARARVRAWPLDAGDVLAAAPPRAPALATAMTDAGGHFTLSRVPHGPLLVGAEHPAYPAAFASATAGAPATVTAPIPGGIDGEVREHVTGAPVAGASVDAVGPNGQRAAIAGKKGAATFRLLRLRPGHWTLTARAPGYQAAVRDLEVPESPILGETSVRGLRIELDQDR
jgi:protocatechuate 3,4-dioxygenase beta subunit